MGAADYIVGMLLAGAYGLVDYLSYHVLLCLIPAFFIAGAISALFNKETVTRYLGPDTPKYISYPVAAISGLLLAVCSCTILPLFTGIWKKGAGLGPAVTFLFTGPAINLLAIVYTGQLIGWDIGISRGVLAIVFGIAIGLIMSVIFERRAKGETTTAVPSMFSGQATAGTPSRTIGLFILLVGILIAGTFPFATLFGGDAQDAFWFFNLPTAVLMAGFAGVWAWRTNSKEENGAWMRETWFFVKTILPLLLIGVFIAGIFGYVIPEDIVADYVGDNSLRSMLIAVGFGVFMYFPTLVEVPVARMFLDLGMSRAALLAYLLADPELSLQSILVIRKVMGNVKTLVYVLLVAVLCVLAGLLFGLVLGVI